MNVYPLYIRFSLLAIVCLAWFCVYPEDTDSPTELWQRSPVPEELGESMGLTSSDHWVFSVNKQNGVYVFSPEKLSFNRYDHIQLQNRCWAISGTRLITTDPDTGDTQVWDLISGKELTRTFVKFAGKCMGLVGAPFDQNRAMMVVANFEKENKGKTSLVEIALPDLTIGKTMPLIIPGFEVKRFKEVSGREAGHNGSIIQIRGKGSLWSQSVPVQRLANKYLALHSPEKFKLVFPYSVYTSSLRGVAVRDAEMVITSPHKRILALQDPHTGRLVINLGEFPGQVSSNQERISSDSTFVHFRLETGWFFFYNEREKTIYSRRIHLVNELERQERLAWVPCSTPVPPAKRGIPWSYTLCRQPGVSSFSYKFKILSPTGATVTPSGEVRFTPTRDHETGFHLVYQVSLGNVSSRFQLWVPGPEYTSGNGALSSLNLTSWDVPHQILHVGGAVDKLLPAMERNIILFRIRESKIWKALDLISGTISGDFSGSGNITLMAAGNRKAVSWDEETNQIKVFRLPDTALINTFTNPMPGHLIGLVMGEHRDDLILLASHRREHGQSVWDIDFMRTDTGELVGNPLTLRKQLTPARPVFWAASPDLSAFTVDASYLRGYTFLIPGQSGWQTMKEHKWMEEVFPISPDRFISSVLLNAKANVIASPDGYLRNHRAPSWHPLPRLPFVYSIKAPPGNQGYQLYVRRKDDLKPVFQVPGPLAYLYHAPMHVNKQSEREPAVLNLHARRLVFASGKLPILVIMRVDVPDDIQIPDPSPINASSFVSVTKKVSASSENLHTSDEPLLDILLSKDASERLTQALKHRAAEQQERRTWENIQNLAKGSIVEIRSQRWVGTGFVFGSTGLILTNRHSLPEFGSPFDVRIPHFSGGVLNFSGIPVARHVTNELALIGAKTSRKWTALPLGNSQKLRAGDTVAVLGHSRSGGQVFYDSLNTTVISHTDRVVGEQKVMQLDLSFNQGLVGAPVFDISGNVVGIMGGIDSGKEGVSYMIPTEEIIMQYKVFLNTAQAE